MKYSGYIKRYNTYEHHIGGKNWRKAKQKVDNHTNGKITSRDVQQVVCQSVLLGWDIQSGGDPFSQFSM